MNVLTALKSVLNRRVTVAALVEGAFWLAIPYVLVGLVLAFAHPAAVSEVQHQLESRLPQSTEFEFAAFGAATLLWPALLAAPAGCRN